MGPSQAPLGRVGIVRCHLPTEETGDSEEVQDLRDTAKVFGQEQAEWDRTRSKEF